MAPIAKIRFGVKGSGFPVQGFRGIGGVVLAIIIGDYVGLL